MMKLIENPEGGHLLQFDIVNTGDCIEKHRQSLLFKPFLELLAKQDFEKVKHRTIGLGLACSRDIATALQGSVTLVRSRLGLTVFRVTMPV